MLLLSDLYALVVPSPVLTLAFLSLPSRPAGSSGVGDWADLVVTASFLGVGALMRILGNLVARTKTVLPGAISAQ